MLPSLLAFLEKTCGQGAALALSGGCDSALLLAVLAQMRRKNDFPLLAVHVQTPLQTTAEADRCAALAARFQVELVTLSPDVLALPAVKENGRDRCYHCKKLLFESILATAAERGFFTVLDGTNADDCREYRPGRQALAELGILSPLAGAGLTKRQVRQLAAEYGLAEADLPAAACLATRFPYDTALTEDCLRRVEAAELFLRAILTGHFRVRIHGIVARIEVEEQAFPALLSARKAIVDELKKLGFSHVTLDLAGFRSGSFDS